MHDRELVQYPLAGFGARLYGFDEEPLPGIMVTNLFPLHLRVPTSELPNLRGANPPFVVYSSRKERTQAAPPAVLRSWPIVCRVLVSRLGAAAVEALADEDSGKMVGLCGDEICRVPLDEVVGEQRPLDPDLYRLAGVLSALSG